MFVLYLFWGRRSFIDPICRNSSMVLSMFWRLVLANSLFSLRDINLTLGLLPPRKHVIWRDSVGVESSRSGLKSECADIFHQSFLWLRHTDEPQRGRNSYLWLESRSVLSRVDVLQSYFSRSTISIAVFCLQNLICQPCDCLQRQKKDSSKLRFFVDPKTLPFTLKKVGGKLGKWRRK